jgi:hypothetical protein
MLGVVLRASGENEDDIKDTRDGDHPHGQPAARRRQPTAHQRVAWHPVCVMLDLYKLIVLARVTA